jgi:hypothetical protein
VKNSRHAPLTLTTRFKRLASNDVAKAVCIGCDSNDFCKKPCPKFRAFEKRMNTRTESGRVIVERIRRSRLNGKTFSVTVTVGIRPEGVK